MSRWSVLGVVVVAVMLGILAVGGGAARGAEGAGAKPELPAALPRADLEALRKVIDEVAAADQVLVIDFWATWCAPCIDLFPDLHARLHELGPKVRPITVTLDSPGRLEKAAIAFLAKHDALRDAYLLDPDSDKQIAVVKGLGERWQDLVVPAILVYDPDGRRAAEFFEGATAEAIAAKAKELVK